jgi:uncharacterized RDD family membrane protein YckC
MTIAAFALAVLGLPAAAAAQAPSAPEAAQPSAPADADLLAEDRIGGSVVRFGQDYTVERNQQIDELVIIGGSATVDGRVRGDVVVILGSARLSSTASVGELVVVAGGASVAPGTEVRRDLVVVAGPFEGPPGFTPGGEQVVITPPMLGGIVGVVVPWLTRGLLWGRPVVPDLPWMWGVLGIIFVLYAVLNLVLDGAVRVCTETLTEKPLTTSLVGLLVMLLAGPVCLLLAVSVVGLAVVPFMFCALLVAAVVGKIGVMRRIGTGVVRQNSPEDRLQSLRSFTIGFVVMALAYMVPILGFVALTLGSVFGLGAAALAFAAAYRGENTGPQPSAPLPRNPPLLPAAADSGDASAPQTASRAGPAPSDLASFPPAAFLDRLGAFGLDVVLVLIAAALLDVRHDPGRFFLWLLVYHIGFWTWKGTTLGGIVCQLRLVRVDGAPLRFVDALVRGLSSIFSLAVVGLGVLWILWDPLRQAWHDKIAGTHVVKVPRNWPL